MSELKMIVTLDDLVIEFASNFSLGMKAVLAAAQTYKLAIQKYPTKAREIFAQRFPTIRRDTWQLLEDIGGGHLPPQATMMTSGAVAKLRTAKLPKSRMEIVAESKVEVYNPQTGTYERIPFTHLSESQADILLNPITHALRDKEQQRRYVKKLTEESQTSVEHRPIAKRPWVVCDNMLVVKRGCAITKEEVREILKQMDGDTE